nr:MAG TPA: hypothetical protein [Caudoviricetes sp.]
MLPSSSRRNAAPHHDAGAHDQSQKMTMPAQH